MAIPTLPDVQAYLVANGLVYDDTIVTQALAGETAAQARRCRVGTPMEDDLAEALRRRVARNLAMRAIPLGVMAGDEGGTPLGSNDPEVRRLELPYRKLVMG